MMDPNSTSEDVKFTPDPYQVPFVQAFDQATRVYQDLGGPSQAPLPCVLWPVLPEPLPQGQLTAYHVSAAPTGSWFPAPQPAPENAYQAYAAPQLFPVSDITQNQQTNQAGGEAPQPGDNSTVQPAAAVVFACPGTNQGQQLADIGAPQPAPAAAPARRTRKPLQPESLEECDSELDIKRYKNRVASRKCRAKFKHLLQHYREVASAKSSENDRLRLLLKQMCPSLDVDSIIPRTPDVLHEDLLNF
ncbi:BZLF1 [human gammaherpesvirus 4]|uniref:BZLF1 n=1 Tax=Epstein-Barr virus (strain GD1) TaxID=10376 RepID=A0A060A1H7_EBVG|nr:viral immediatly early antigen [human gammaherpesvirus 4]AIA57651.1 viral immediatly early antigen [human gammaherpesvirus 4]AIA57653.1 viral immediatly early antigen [human gammaherpesvirus 4]ALQ28631.1 BZLF1 [human gammaherpesvirus 4]WOR09991.1 BZLF1 [human gammaherpesvirus 4]